MHLVLDRYDYSITMWRVIAILVVTVAKNLDTEIYDDSISLWVVLLPDT